MKVPLGFKRQVPARPSKHQHVRTRFFTAARLRQRGCYLILAQPIAKPIQQMIATLVFD
jgi:hypothetical protein